MIQALLPSEWRAIRLGEILEFKNGLNKSKSFFGAGTPIVNFMDVLKYPVLTKQEVLGRVTLTPEEIKRFSARQGDVFFTRTSESVEEIGTASVLVDTIPNAVFSGFVLRGRPRSFDLDQIFLAYALRAGGVRNQITATASYTTRALTNGKSLARVQLPIPPAGEQHAIAGVLADMDASISSLARLIAKKQAIKTGMTQRLLTGKIRLPGFGGAWKEWRLEDVCMKIQDGTHFSPMLGGSDFKYVTSKNIGIGELRLNEVATISASEHQKIYRRCDTRYGDLLLTKDGANTGNAAINSFREEISLLSSVAFIRCNHRLAQETYILQYLLSRDGRRQIADLMAGNAITRLTLRKIKDLRVVLPPVDEQSAIALVLGDTDRQVYILRARMAKAQAIKQGIMQELLTGRIRLPVSEAVS